MAVLVDDGGAGRPLRDGAALVLAPAADDPAWCGDVGPMAGPQEAGRWWAHVGALEHASAASFARFLLQLTRLGAPPDLISRAAEAAADEVRHAQAAFAIAAALLGRPVGPGPLEVERAPAVWDAAGVLREVVRDGCVGETLSVAEATAALEQAEDPRVRSALESMIADESRHAALAWRTVRWLVGERPSLRAVAQEALSEACAEAARPASGSAGAEPWGVLSGPARNAVRRRTLEREIPALAWVILETGAGVG